MDICKKFLRIDSFDNYDAMNLLQVNLVRAMLADAADCTLQLTWINLQHVMAKADTNWVVCDYLKKSTPEQPVGCIKFLRDKADERKNELRMSRQASFMAQSDCRDFRAYFPEFCSFSVANALSNLQKRAVLDHETTDDVIERNTALMKEHDLKAREQA